MAIIVFLSTFILYLFTMAPTFTVGDAGEFCASGVILGIPHSPGYPLFCLLAKVCAILVPWGTPAYRVTLCSAVAGAGCVSLVYSILRDSHPGPRLAKHGTAPDTTKVTLTAFFCSLLLALSPAFWHSAIQAEVFTLNAFCAALIVRAIQRDKPLLASLILGLGLGNNLTLAVLGILILAGLLRRRQSLFSDTRGALFFFVIGFSVYLYLYVRAAFKPMLNWGDPENLHNFWRVVTRADYGSLSLTVGDKIARSLPGTAQQFARYFSILGRQLTLPGVLAGAAGWITAFRAKNTFVRPIFLCWLFAGPGFIVLANLPFVPESEGILERFYVLSNLFWIFPVYWILQYSLERFDRLRLPAMALPLLCVPLTAGRFPESDWRNYYLAYDYGRNLLRTLPVNAILFMDGGDDTFYSLAYLCFGERRRPDLELHDRGGLVFRNIYGSDFRSLTKEEKEQRRREVESRFLGSRPVYYSTFNRNIFPNMPLVPDGILLRPPSARTANAWFSYSLRSVWGKEYTDYRSRALAPLYPYFYGLDDPSRLLEAWNYARERWPDAAWLGGNLRIELEQEAFRKFNAGETETAGRYYRQLIRWFPDDVSALVNLGVIEENRGFAEKAREYYRSALTVNPRYADAYYNLSVLAWKQEKWDEVVNTLQELLKVNPGDARAMKFLPMAEAHKRGTGGK